MGHELSGLRGTIQPNAITSAAQCKAVAFTGTSFTKHGGYAVRCSCRCLAR